MIYISNSIYLATRETTESVRNKPIIGYHSVFRPEDITGSVEWGVNSLESLRNIWSPDTYTHFRSGDFIEPRWITIQNPTGEDINYIAIVGHNMATWQYNYQIEYYDGSSWIELISKRTPPNNDLIMHYFDPIQTNQIRFNFDTGWTGIVPDEMHLKIAHMKIGECIFLQRRRFVGVKPYTMDVQYEGVENVSSNGNYLGSYVTSESQNWEIKQSNNSPDFVREKIIPFIKHMNGVGEPMNGPPFTFVAAWRPDDYPSEVLYCWKPVGEKVVPEISGRNGLMTWEATGKGIR